MQINTGRILVVNQYAENSSRHDLIINITSKVSLNLKIPSQGASDCFILLTEAAEFSEFFIFFIRKNSFFIKNWIIF